MCQFGGEVRRLSPAVCRRAENEGPVAVLAHVCCWGTAGRQRFSPWSCFRWFLETGAVVDDQFEEPGGIDGRGDHQEDRGGPRFRLHFRGGRQGVLLPPQRHREL